MRNSNDNRVKKSGALFGLLSFDNRKRLMAICLSFVMVASLVIAIPHASFADAGTPAAPPAITHQPIGTATYAKSAHMRVYLNASSVDGGHLTYQWYRSALIPDAQAKDGTTLTQAEMDTIKANGPVLITGATSATLNTDSENTPGYYYYWAVVTNYADTNGDGDADDTDESVEVTSGFQLVHVVGRTLPLQLENGNFETTNLLQNIATNSWQSIPALAPTGISAQSQYIPYWNTTHDGARNDANTAGANDTWTPYCKGKVIELHDTGFVFPNDRTKYGNHQIELAASKASSVYQEIATEPGKIYEWSLDHAARNGYNSGGHQMIAVVIGPAINGSTDYSPSVIDRYTGNEAFTYNVNNTNGTSWYTGYNGSYTWDYPYGKNQGCYFNDIVNSLGLNADQLATIGTSSNPTVTAHYNGKNYYIYLSDNPYNSSSIVKHRAGQYTVPTGQGTTVFGFVAVFGGTAGGNSLDNITFKTGDEPSSSDSMSHTGESSLSVGTKAGFAYAVAEVRDSSPINLIGLTPTYTPAGGENPSATPTSGLGTVGADWYAGYTAYDMAADTGTGTGFADGGKLTFTGLTPGKTYRVIGIPIGAISPGLETNLSAAEVLDDGYYDDVLLDPVYEGEPGKRPANVKVELYKNSSSEDRLRAIVEHSDARVEYALLGADMSNPSNPKYDPGSVAAVWTPGTGANLNFDGLDPAKIYYLTARPRGQNEVSYADAAKAFTLKIGSQSQGMTDIPKEDVSREAGTTTDEIKVKNTESTSTYYALDVSTGSYTIQGGVVGNNGEITFTDLVPAKVYQIVKKITLDDSLVMLKGVRVYPYATPLYIDYVDERIENTSGAVPADTEYAINAEAGGAGAWLAGDASTDTWLRGLGTSGVDLTEIPASAGMTGGVSILDSIAQGTSGEMSYRVIAGSDGYSGASVSPETTLPIPPRPNAPTPTVLSPLESIKDYMIDYKSEDVVAGAGRDIQVSERNSHTWTDISATGAADFSDLDWRGTADKDIDVRFKAIASAPDITATTSEGSFASFSTQDKIVKRPAPPSTLSATYNSTDEELTISGFVSGTAYQYSIDSGSNWKDVSGTSLTEDYNADDPSAVDIAVRFAATDTAPCSWPDTFGASILISPVIMDNLEYGYDINNVTPYQITITNITGTEVTGATLTLDGTDSDKFEITPTPAPSSVTVPANDGTNNGMNEDYLVTPKPGLDAGVYTTTLTVSYSVSGGGGTKTATAEVILRVDKVPWDISAMTGRFSGTEDSLTLDMTGAPVGAKLDYRIGTADWVIGSADVPSSKEDSHVYSDLQNGSANPLSPQSAYNLSVKAAADDNHYESGVYHITGYTAYATPVWRDVLSVNYRTEVLSFNTGYVPDEYTVMVDTGTGQKEIRDMASLTSYADGTGDFSISIQHKKGSDATPYPVSAVATEKIDCRGAAPDFTDFKITPATTPYASDGVIEYLVGNIGGVGSTLTSFGYRAHREDGAPDGYQVVGGTAHVSPGRYDVRIPATAATFGSHPTSVTVAGSTLSVLLHTKTVSSGGVLPANISGIARPGTGWNPVTGVGAEGQYDHDYLVEYTPLTLPALSDVQSSDYIFCGWYSTVGYDSGNFSGSPVTATPNDALNMINRVYWAKWAIKPALDTIHSASLTGLSTNRTGLTEATAITGSVTLPATTTSVGSGNVTASDDDAISVYSDDAFSVSGPVSFSPGNTGDTEHVYVRVSSAEDSTAYVYYDITVTVLPQDAAAPTITTQPTGYTKYDDDTAAPLTAEATGGNGTLTYQWYVNTSNNAVVDDAHKIAGATSASYTPTDRAIETKYYYVVATRTVPGAAVETASSAASSIAEVTWQNRPGNATAPTIDADPTGYTKYDDDTATALTASASGGNGTLTYQWYVNTTSNAVVDDAHKIAGETSASYTPPKTIGTRFYYVVATNTVTDAITETASSSPSDVAEVTWKIRPANAVAPTISTPPQDAFYYTDASSATPLSVSFSNSGTGTLTYQWYKNTADNTTSGTAITGETSATYTPPITTDGTTYYYVVVTATQTGALTPTATAVSDTAEIEVQTRPVAALTNGSALRTSATAATIGFETSQPGTAYYLESSAVPSAADVVDTGTSLGSVSGTVSGKNITLPSEGDKTVYVVVVNSAGNSSVLAISVTKFDNIKPTIDAITPSSTGVNVSGTITVTFSEAMDTSAGTLSFSSGTGSIGGYSLSNWSSDAKTYTVSYSGLDHGTTYTVVFTDFTDAAQNDLESGVARQFTTIAQYTVTFNIGTVDGGSTTPGQIKGDIGTSVALPDGTGFSRTGFTFGGWSSKTSNPTESDTDYPIGKKYTSATDTTETLYAVWVQNVALIFHSEGGSDVAPAHIDPADVKYGDVAGWPTSDPAKSGYIFAGWYYEEKDGGAGPSTRVYAATPIDTTATQSITLHAHWTPDVDKTALGNEVATVAPKLPDIHAENYAGSVYQTFTAAYTAAKTVYDDPNATQAQVNTALATLQGAYGALTHDHPALKHSHDTSYGGVNHLTRFGDTVRIEFKGDIRDVTGFRLNGTNYPLTSGGVNIYNITENGNVIGTITEGSAVVTFPAAFADRFANGTHKATVVFTDATGTASGTADLVVDRHSGEGDNGGNGNDPDKGPAILPQTGDDMPVDLLLAISVLSLCGLLLLLFALRRKKKEERRRRHAA